MRELDETVFVNLQIQNEENKPELKEAEKSVVQELPKSTTNGVKQDTMHELYAKLGKAYYEGAFEDPLPELLPLFDQITRMKKAAVPPVNVCKSCGKELGKNAVFCGSCGAKV